MPTVTAMSSQVQWGVSLALISMLTYGACMVLVSTSAHGMGSGAGSLFAAIAGVPAGFTLVLLQLGTGIEIAMPSAWGLCAFALAGICSTYLGRWLIFRSIELMGPSNASGLQSTSPLITAVIGWLILGETITLVGAFGFVLGLVGLLVMNAGIRQSTLAGRPQNGLASFVSSATLIGLASATAYSVSHVLRASAVRDWTEPLVGALIGAVAGVLTLLLASRKQLSGYLRDARRNAAGVRMYMTVGALQFVAQSLAIASMKFIPASVAALISMSTPLIVMPLSYFVLRGQQKMSAASVIGICITLTGIALVILHSAAES